MGAATVISPSTAFLLDEIRRIFAEHEERMDRRFSSSLSAAASVAPAPVVTTSVAPAPSAPPTSTTAASSPSASAASTTSSTHIDPVARGAKEVVDFNLPSRCSIVCRSADAREPVPMSTAAATMMTFSDTVSTELADPNIIKRVANNTIRARVLQIQTRECEDIAPFIDGDLGVARPHRAPLRKPRPRRPRRAPPRLPRLRRPRRGRLRVLRLRRPRRAPPRPPRPRRPWRTSQRVPRPRRPRRAPPRPIRPLRRRPQRAMVQQNDDDITSSSPTICSTKCLSCNIDMLKSENTLPTRWIVPPMSLHLTPEIPPDITKCCLFIHLKGRYINITPSLSSGVVLLCVATDGHAYQMVLKSIKHWPPSLKHKKTLLPITIVLDFSLTSQAVVKPRRPTQWALLVLNALLRPIPCPSWCYHTTVLQLADFLMFNGLSIIIPICSNLFTAWHLKCCWAYTLCQVLNFSWSPCLHLNLKLRVSQHTLQVILVLYTLGFEVWSTSCTLRFHSNVSVQWKPSCVPLICLYMSNGCVVSSTIFWPNGLLWLCYTLWVLGGDPYVLGMTATISMRKSEVAVVVGPAYFLLLSLLEELVTEQLLGLSIMQGHSSSVKCCSHSRPPGPSFCGQPVDASFHSSVSICRLALLHFNDSRRYLVECLAVIVQSCWSPMERYLQDVTFFSLVIHLLS